MKINLIIFCLLSVKLSKNSAFQIKCFANNNKNIENLKSFDKSVDDQVKTLLKNSLSIDDRAFLEFCYGLFKEVDESFAVLRQCFQKTDEAKIYFEDLVDMNMKIRVYCEFDAATRDFLSGDPPKSALLKDKHIRHCVDQTSNLCDDTIKNIFWSCIKKKIRKLYEGPDRQTAEKYLSTILTFSKGMLYCNEEHLMFDIFGLYL